MPNTDREDLIRDIIAQLDSAVGSGVGHVNVSVSGDGKADVEHVTVCDAACASCRTPTLHEGSTPRRKTEPLFILRRDFSCMPMNSRSTTW